MQLKCLTYASSIRGYRIKAITPAFQAGDEGSIPSTRSSCISILIKNSKEHSLNAKLSYGLVSLRCASQVTSFGFCHAPGHFHTLHDAVPQEPEDRHSAAQASALAAQVSPLGTFQTMPQPAQSYGHRAQHPMP